MSDRESFDNYIGSLPSEVQTALFANLDKVGELGRRLVVATSSIFAHSLVYSPGLIVRLVRKAGFEAPNISDAYYPTDSEGVAELKFRFLDSKSLRRPDGLVYDRDVDIAFAREEMSRCNVAEGLLVLAEDHQVGMGEQKLVILLRDTVDVFTVYEQSGKRRLRQVGDDDGNNVWSGPCIFLGVCR